MSRSPVTHGLAALATLMVSALPVLAREVRLTTTMARNFIGGAYAVVYVVDAEGKYAQTVHVFGTTQRYYSHLRNWYRATGLAGSDRAAEVDGRSGASLRRGQVAELTVELADALFDVGYVLRIDSTLYEGRDYGTDAEVPLVSAASGVPAEGRGYVKSLRFDL
ncbi:MAG: DUF2271 domain-containing protein [Phaeovulum sp.]|uniref:DUF2271 domain-containing protein n=1 Tax=Phaeovulum sp. TaxID=2934796 RepID=UPI00273363AE|nr:DUF2271 domain-containing protein [Phaeovulum sp.]MDP3862104.1 DUF2271 domain-containing protein [Phaeovulum sp.]